MAGKKNKTQEFWTTIKTTMTGQFTAINPKDVQALEKEIEDYSNSPDAPQMALPKDGFAGLAQNWRQDMTSGFILFLIALPLSLGIAMASGVPPMAGIIAASCGGMLVSQINGSFVTINGPAAGLIVVILTAVEALGGGAPLPAHVALATGERTDANGFPFLWEAMAREEIRRDPAVLE